MTLDQALRPGVMDRVRANIGAAMDDGCMYTVDDLLGVLYRSHPRSTADQLAGAFAWATAPEGTDYWAQCAEALGHLDGLLGSMYTDFLAFIF